MIKVLIVEDSPVAKELLIEVISSNKDIEIVGVAETGEDALKLNEELTPDLITMDVNLPRMNGLEATKRIMATRPVPIIIVSSGFEPHNIDHSIEALKAGAVAIAKKPDAYGTDDYKDAGAKLVQMIKLMSEIKVVKRKGSADKIGVQDGNANINKAQNKKIEIIGIGASTGGPVVIEDILSNLPSGFNIPIVIVQHIAQGFTNGFVEWLGQKSDLTVLVAQNNMVIEPGKCYIAPEDFHLKINSDATIQLVKEPLVNGVIPSVSVFFDSLVKNFGDRALAILLSGMGKDGADKLKVLKEAGAVTIAQDSSSSLIFGMPGEAVKLNAAKYVMSKEGIISFLNGLYFRNEEPQ